MKTKNQFSESVFCIIETVEHFINLLTNIYNAYINNALLYHTLHWVLWILFWSHISFVNVIFLKSMSEEVGTTLDLNNNSCLSIQNGLNMTLLKFSRYIPAPTLSDIDFRNKMALVWTTLNSCAFISIFPCAFTYPWFKDN